MDTIIIQRLTPDYSHEKLENPSFMDLVDVFESWWVNYTFSPVRSLLNLPDAHGDTAAMMVLCSYFETIASYISGEDSNGRSKEFFVLGFCQVFDRSDPQINDFAKTIYKYIRCGLAHEGMMNHKVNYSRAGANALMITSSKNPDGSLKTEADDVKSIKVNPMRFYEGVDYHFKTYIGKLRSSSDQ